MGGRESASDSVMVETRALQLTQRLLPGHGQSLCLISAQVGEPLRVAFRRWQQLQPRAKLREHGRHGVHRFG